MHGLVPPFHAPRIMSLQSLDQEEVGLKLLWPVISFDPHWCDQYLHWQNTNVDFHTPWSLHIELFTLDLERRLHKMSKWMHRVSYSPILEESHLSDAGLAMDNSHLVALPLSSRNCSSRMVVVHLVHVAHTTIQRGVPSVGAMRKVSFVGGLVSILSTGSSWGRKGHLQQPGTPLHMFPSPTSPSHSSFHCRHQL